MSALGQSSKNQQSATPPRLNEMDQLKLRFEEALKHLDRHIYGLRDIHGGLSGESMQDLPRDTTDRVTPFPAGHFPQLNLMASALDERIAQFDDVIVKIRKFL